MKHLIVEKGMSVALLGKVQELDFMTSAFTKAEDVGKRDLGSDRNFPDCSFLHSQFCMQRMKCVILAVEYGGTLICSDAFILALS